MIESNICPFCNRIFKHFSGVTRHAHKIHNIKDRKLIYMEQNYISEVPKCKCGCDKDVKFKHNKFNDYKIGHCFKTKNGIEKRKQTWLKTLGVEHNSQNKEVRNKRKETLIKNFGVDEVFKSEEYKANLRKKYGEKNYSNRQKMKKTCLEKYGTEEPLANKEIYKKTKKTKEKRYGSEKAFYFGSKEFKENLLDKYGDKYYNNIKKAKQTNLKKYGVEFNWQRNDVKEKVNKTCLDRYGVDNYAKSAESRKNRPLMSKETRKNMRIAAIKRIEKNSSQCMPNFNPTGCKIIDEYGQKYGYNFQHALNGGEFHIKELGYFVDGYDKDKNVVIEIDEQKHYDENKNLKQRDVNRQKEIEEFLSCKFIRIKI